jgi:hypothetical protein
MIHELKTDPVVFQESWVGNKMYEIRYDDRGFNVGDILILKEITFNREEYTGRQLTRIVTNKTTEYGMQDGWCILGVKVI